MLPGKSDAVLKETAAMSAWNPFTFILPGHKVIPDGETQLSSLSVEEKGDFDCPNTPGRRLNCHTT